MTSKYRIVLVDDHVMFRRGLKRILEERSDFEIIGEAADGLELLGMLKSRSAEVVILDISMPNLRGMEAIHQIRKLCPDTKVIILTMHKDRDYLEQAFAEGAHGYVLKEDARDELFSAIDAVLQEKSFASPRLMAQSLNDPPPATPGKNPLTSGKRLSSREVEVLKLIAEGKSSAEVAELLSISVRTVERHRATIMDKLQLRNTADMVRFAISKGYI